jgi:transposase InsO family protein
MSALRCLGITHQRSAVGYPWQNRRSERFFGTLKQALNQWTFGERRAASTVAGCISWLVL